MLNHQLTLALLLTGTLVLACAPSDTTPSRRLTYQFADSESFRVETKFQVRNAQRKSHQGKMFSAQEDQLFVQAAFHLRTRPLDNNQLAIEYTLLRLRSHDQEGNFRLEIGPDSGELYWYGKQEDLVDYLGEAGWVRYQEIIRQPLARVVITSRGIQQPDDAQAEGGPGFNHDLTKLLHKNRVIGERIMKSLKIPPVLMAILPEQPARVGTEWTYTGQAAQGLSTWDKPLDNQFSVVSGGPEGLRLRLRSQLKFSSEELTSLGKYLGFDDLKDVQFKSSAFHIGGEIVFLPVSGRPEKGNMKIEKKYGLRTGEEDWEMEETEEYEFSLEPISQGE